MTIAWSAWDLHAMELVGKGRIYYTVKAVILTM